MRRTEIKKGISVVVISALLAGNMNLLAYASTEEGRQQEITVEVTPDIPINSNADDFEIQDGVLIKYNGSAANVVIPEGVTSIDGYCAEEDDCGFVGAFEGCTTLRTITLPKSLKSIEHSAFEGCENLIAINVDEDNITYSSSDGILYDKKKRRLEKCPCAVTNVEIASSVEEIGSYAFSGCKKLKTVNLPENLYYVRWNAFENCKSLTEIEIPSSVWNVDTTAFYGCDNLVAINVDKENQNYSSVNGILYDKEKKRLKVCPYGKEYVEIEKGVEEIESCAFREYKKLKTVKFPESLHTIETDAFSGCINLESIDIPNSVAYIGEGVFGGCKNLESINLPKSVTHMGDSAFANCESLKGINLPEGVESISDEMFRGCISLESIYIPSTVTYIY